LRACFFAFGFGPDLGDCVGRHLGQPLCQGALRGMGAVAAGLIIATGLKLTRALLNNVMGLTACFVLGFVTFVCVGLLRWPLAGVLLGLGLIASIVAYAKLGPTGLDDAPGGHG